MCSGVKIGQLYKCYTQVIHNLCICCMQNIHIHHKTFWWACTIVWDKVCVVVLSMLPSLTMTKQQMKKSVQVVTLKAVDEFADAPFWESMLWSMHVQVWGSGWEFTFNDKEVKALWWTAWGMVVIFEVSAHISSDSGLDKKMWCVDLFWWVLAYRMCVLMSLFVLFWYRGFVLMSSFVFGDGFCHVGNHIVHVLYSYPICHHTILIVDMFNVVAIAQQPLV